MKARAALLESWTMLHVLSTMVVISLEVHGLVSIAREP
jgi:hypothetical protein